MPYRDPDPADPHELVGVSVPGDLESTREMAVTFAEEFAILGYGEERLLSLFRQPFYAGAHRAYRILGEEEIRRIVRDSCGLWGRVEIVVRDTAREPLVQIGRRTQPRLRDDDKKAKRCQR